MAGLGKLSHDILLEVLLLSCCLEDLHAIILSTRLFFDSFTSRRKVIIGHVFRQQVISASLTPSAIIKHADIAVQRLSMCNQGDAVIIYEALSPLLSKDAPSRVNFRWALKLYRWYGRVEDGSSDRPLQLLEHVHRSLLSIPSTFNPAASGTAQEQPPEKGRRPNTHRLDPIVQDLCHLLVEEYTARDRLGDAVAVQKSIHQRLRLTDPDSRRWGAEIVTGLRALGQFNEAIEYEMSVYQIAKASTNNPNPSLEWARHLVSEYTLAGQTLDALQIQKVVLADLRPGTGEYLAWARHLVRMQKRAGLEREALDTKSSVWQRLSRRDQCYCSWAKELADDFRRMFQPNEAVGVIESLYQELRGQLSRRPCDHRIRCHANHAKRALVKEYQSCGRFESAAEIENMAV